MILSLVIVHFALAAIALLKIYRNSASTKGQKGYQSMVAILVPLLGPIIVIIMNFYIKAKPSAQKTAVGDSADDHIRKHGPYPR